MGKGVIPKSFIEQLLAQVDIVQVIGQRVPLKKAGKNYVACCPFHHEKTPSFNVSPVKQFYHCFGCGASGDAIRFLQAYDGLSFPDAVEALAQQVGLHVPYEQLSSQQQQQQQRQATLYEVLQQAARFYRYQLRDHPEAEVAKAYLRQRGLTPEIAKAYYLGYAPSGWDALTQAFQPWSAYEPLLLEAGLRVAREGRSGSYDRFRHRIMFPIRDVRGRVVGFGGRVLGDDKPKYLNSPESPVFHKSRVLYGLYELLQRRIQLDHIIVVEGYMDVIALAQHGVWNSVATLGTAVTAEHLDILYRRVDQAVFSFDGDAAGRKAAWKAVELLLPNLNERQSAKIMFLPEGEDPDSLVRKLGREVFLKRIKDAPDVVGFVVQALIAQLPVPVTQQEGRRQFLAGVTPWLKLAQGWYQAVLLEMAADVLGVKPWQLAKQLGIYVPLAGSGGHYRQTRHLPPPVLGVPHRLVRYLLAQPERVERLFSEEELEALARMPEPGMTLLVEVVRRLQQGASPQAVKQHLMQAGEKTVLSAIEQIPLPAEGQEGEQMFEALLQQLMEQVMLAQTEDLETVLALKSARKKSDEKAN